MYTRSGVATLNSVNSMTILPLTVVLSAGDDGTLCFWDVVA
jgi:hypothetical protein